MSSRNESIKLLRERRDKLRFDMQTLQTRIDEVDVILRALGDETAPNDIEKRTRRGDLKEVVLSLFEEAAEGGLSAQACVRWAKDRRGLDLHPGSVSSLLSRLKADGVLFYDGDRYRLKRYAGPRNPNREAV